MEMRIRDNLTISIAQQQAATQPLVPPSGQVGGVPTPRMDPERQSAGLAGVLRAPFPLERLPEAVEGLNTFFGSLGQHKGIKFKIQEGQTVVVQVMNADGDVIRQIPPEEFVSLLEHLEKFFGIFVDEEV